MDEDTRLEGKARTQEGEGVANAQDEGEDVKTLTDSDIEVMQALATARASSTSMKLTKDTVLVLVEAYRRYSAEHALRVQIEKERVETARQVARLLEEKLRLREALADIARGDYSDPLCQRTPEQRARDALARHDEAVVDALVRERTSKNPKRTPLPRREPK